MPRAIALRSDFGAVESRCLARRSRDAPQARSLLALAAIYDGGTRSEAARLGNVTLQIVRDWVVCFNAAATDGLRDRKAPGPNAADAALRLPTTACAATTGGLAGEREACVSPVQ